MAHQELGFRLLERVKTDLIEHAVVEQFPKMEGRQLVMVLTPKKVQPKAAAAKSSPKTGTKVAGTKPADTPVKVAATAGATAQDAAVVDKK
jgi:translation initiation factor IF-3